MSQPPARGNKLDQLTSLRFFAALLIVVHHAESMMGIGGMGVNWGQGVSFFFVLSGFILTYVYPRLATLDDTQRFLRARVARIWPAHVASFALGFALMPYAWDTWTAIANLLLVHAWIPQSAYYFSYNGVSWSVSTEAFFYLAFPLLILG
ncbi:MAG: acyltransferase, partial [Pseudoxanthomonas sp.]|nr:acyltransferase [Pseudoxanthomonas sp.]